MNSFTKAFLRLFIPLLVVILVAAGFYISDQRKNHYAELLSSESTAVLLGAAMLDRRVQIVRRDIEFLSRHLYISPTLEKPGRLDFNEMAKGFNDFLVVKPSYAGIRWIDANGQVKVHVKLVNGFPVDLPQAELEPIPGAEFDLIMADNPGQVHFSPITLQTEKGVVQSPHTPIVRAAMPISDGRGKKTGAFVFDYLADEMIAYVEAVTPMIQDHLFLTTTAGYFFHAPNVGDKWGFVLNAPEQAMPNRFPETWNNIKDQNQGQFIDASGLWTFRTVYPMRSERRDIESIRNSQKTLPQEHESYRQWRIISHLDPVQVSHIVGRNQAAIFPFVGLLILLGALFSFLIARARFNEDNADQRLRIFFDQSMVGMAITSPDKKWISVNSALCTMLGYAESELLSKTWEALTYPDDLQNNLEYFEQVQQGLIDGYQLQKRFVRADGGLVFTSISARVVRDKDGAPRYFLLIVEDVSDKVLAEKEREQLNATLRSFIDHLPGLAYVKDYESRVLVANQRFSEMVGLAAEQIVGKLTSELFPGEAGEKFTADDLRVIANGQTERLIETLAGRTYETIKFPIPYLNSATGLGGITIDVTERQLNEAWLLLQAARDRVLLDLPQKCLELDERAFMSHVLDMAEMLTKSKIGFMHFVNPDQESIELVAWSTQTLAKYCHAAFDNHYPISQAGIWANAARTKQPVVYNDYEGIKVKNGLPPGHSSLVRLISVPVLEGELVCLMTGVGNKETDYDESDIETIQLLGNEAWHLVRQRRVEDALRVANQVVNASPVVCFRWAATEGWPVLYVSENVTQWGYTKADLLAGKPPFSELVHPDDLLKVSEEVARHHSVGSASYVQEYRLITAENKLIWVVDRTMVQRDANGDALYYDGVLTDITERKSQELSLSNTLAEQRKLIQRLGEAQVQILQSEKMASIGQLAAGIAHELNNPIGFVHSNLGTLNNYLRDLMELIDTYEALTQTEMAGNPKLRQIETLRLEQDFNYIRQDITQLMLESKEGLARVRQIVQDLKSFSHVSEQEWQWADVHQGLESTLNIVWNELKYKCTIIKDYGDLPQVYCMISQLNQVFMNMLVNAGHAIEDRGEIIVRTARLGEDEVCIEFTDTGKGISPENIKRIFEPFFTTKPVGKGTGLGLSISYGIINKHHGRIEVESSVGQGTTFRIVLPVNQAEVTENLTADVFV